MPIIIAPDQKYELKGVNADNIANISTTCGELELDDTTNSALLISTSDVCFTPRCYSTCDLVLYNTLLIIRQSSPMVFEQYPFPSLGFVSVAGLTGTEITPITLPSINDYINLAVAQNCIYSFDPPLPTGLELWHTSIIGTPLNQTSVTIKVSAVDALSKISIQIGVVEMSFTDPIPVNSLAPGSLTAAIVGSILGFAVIILAVVIIRQRRKARQPYDFSNLVKEVVEEISIDSEKKIPVELNRSVVKVVDLLGKGSFAKVYKGMLTEKGKPDFLVAIKSLNNSMDRASDRLELLSEASMLAQFDHRNVVKLIGVVTSGDPLYIVMEYCEAGSMQRVLQLVKLKHSNLLKLSIDCAEGMTYLASLHYVHRDLAARNVFVSSDFTAKIGDFGLSRIHEDSEYYISRNATISIRWSSPEALEERRFSEQSDVWSFGVLLYEIWSHGAIPYEGLTAKAVWTKVIKGLRLQQQSSIPNVIYGVMQLCWGEYGERPVFTALREILLDLSRPDAIQSLATSATQSTNSTETDPRAASDNAKEIKKHAPPHHHQVNLQAIPHETEI